MRDPKLRFLMTPVSRLRYMAWRVAPISPTISVSLKGGEKLCLRRLPSTDSGIAYEVFAQNIYRGPRAPQPDAVKQVVDLGSNTGISVVYWAWRYPAARIDAFEPHPVHLAMLEGHLKTNRIGSRVAVHPVAVGTSAGTARLTDEQGSSRIENSTTSGFSVPVVDLFKTIGRKRIDLLKIDIEGAEFAIFMDQRFAELDLGSISFEWHNYPPHPADADGQIFSRLERLGWHTARGPESADQRGKVGIGYAYR
jgi:FkbM family methyltransferase